MPRLLVIMPSWVGDVVMATPALALIRARFPGAFVGGLARPGMDALLAGCDFFDELHVERASGVFGPKFVAARIRPRRYESALVLANSFSSALTARIAGIPRRVGYDRDARGLLLTDRLKAPRRGDGSWAPIPAVAYYWHAALAVLGEPAPPLPDPRMPALSMRLGCSEAQEAQAREVLARAGAVDRPYAILNPGGNNPAKRWPADRFAELARWLRDERGLISLVNGSPDERELVERIAADSGGSAIGLAGLGVTLGSLKGVVRGARLMVTNDTGPRHIAAAFGVPLVSLFGPTDHRWTTIPTQGREAIVLADPTLPESELANDHPDRCRIERISLASVRDAVERVTGP